MANNLAASELLDLIAKRSSGDRWGIGTAELYVKSIAPCFSSDGDGSNSGLCPASVFEQVKSSPDLWQKALAESAERLTYCDEVMIVEGVKSFDAIQTEQFLDNKSATRTRRELAIKNAILTFDHVVTSNKKDRDGDVMECEGAEIDEAMPLLWQHIQLQPIGTYLGTRVKNANLITGSSAILDTSLGRDVAVLLEGGALRISHGFKAFDAEPLYRKDMRDLSPYGVRVKKFGIMEVSLVSVPANTDAVITAYSRKKLNDPLVKSWAGRMYESRPVVVSGADVSGLEVETKTACTCGDKQVTQANTDQAAGQTANLNTKAATQPNDGKYAKQHTCPKCKAAFDLTGVPDGVDVSKVCCPICGTCVSGDGKSFDLDGTKAGKVFAKRNCERIKQAHGLLNDCVKEMESETGETEGKSAVGLSVKSVATLDTKVFGADSDYLTGSYEWIRESLQRDARRFLVDSTKVARHFDGSTYIVATFGNSAVICVSEYGRYEDRKTECYSASWAMTDGKPKFTGEPTEVKIESSIVTKATELFTKAAKLAGVNTPNAPIPAPLSVKHFIAQALAKPTNETLDDLQMARRDLTEAINLIGDQLDAEEMRRLLAEAG